MKEMPGKPGCGDGRVARLCSAAKARPAPVLPKELPLCRMKPKRASLTSDGVKMCIYESTACSLLSMESEAPEMGSEAGSGNLGTPGVNWSEIENRANRLSFAEKIWSTRTSPWSVLVDRGGP